MTSLDGLRALEQAASPGPWRAHDDHWIFDAADEVVFAGSMLVPDDAEFVVAARNALPGLLGRVEAAEAERDAAHEASEALKRAAFLRADAALTRAEHAEAERDALREKLERYGQHLRSCSVWLSEDADEACTCGYVSVGGDE